MKKVKSESAYFSRSNVCPYLNLTQLKSVQSNSRGFVLVTGKIDLDDVVFAACLDSMGRSISTEEGEEAGLIAHVSRPPKEGQALHSFLSIFEATSNSSGSTFELNHKKINLANEMLAWDHERFSLNKIPAFTLSHFRNFKDPERSSMTDTMDFVDKKVLVQNIKHFVYSLAKYIYKNEEVVEHLFNEQLDVSEEFVSAWLEQMCTKSRAASLLTKNHPLVNNLFQHFTHYLQESVKLPVKVSTK